MDYFQLRESLRSRLPGIDQEALNAWEEFIADMNAGDPRGAKQMRGELYAEMLLIQQDYGDELATSLFNMGARHTVNTFELPGAAEMLSCGMDESAIFDEITSCGWHPSEEHEQRVRFILRNLG